MVPSTLIIDLKKQHDALIDLLDKIDRCTSAPDRLSLLKELKSVAVAHLQVEDDYLYPHLLDSQDVALVKIGATFSSLMADYSELFLTLLDKVFSSKGDLSKAMLDEYVLVSTKLRDRITVEESILFPAYEKATSK